ncbi:MAG: class I SAM-dependent methyltransferase [Candidatus Methylarchaceae archaeon HK02M2]|nr:class I SAM-dependent methyltransferase [Candidatus Methylarchaceae archaeon HK02M2]
MLEFGLAEQWHKVIEALYSVMLIYEHVNHLISFGRDKDFRKEGIIYALPSADIVLDAGCGPGVMSEVALKSGLNIKDLILLDPIPEYLKLAKRRLEDKRPEAVVGLFEVLPFKRKKIDLVMCGFSLRDAMNMALSIREVSRVLREDGKFIIVDLGKPDDLIKRWVMGIWWRFIVPSMAVIFVREKGLFYSILHTTYRQLPKNSELKNIIGRSFDEVIFKVKMHGGVVLVIAKKTAKSNTTS